MIEIGTVVVATVVRIEPYGMFLKYGDDEIFVPIGNFEWVPTQNFQFKIGNKLDILVLRLNYETNIYTGSIKHLHSEKNPYRDLSRYPANTIFKGIVKLIHANGITIQMPNGCMGELFITPATESLSKGMEVDVQIASLEVDNENLTLKLPEVS